MYVPKNLIFNFFLSQISDKDLMKLVRQKVKLAMPYAGAFLKKDDRYSFFDFVFFPMLSKADISV